MAHTLRNLRPLSFYGRNEILYFNNILIIIYFSNMVDWNIASNIGAYYLPCTWSIYWTLYLVELWKHLENWIAMIATSDYTLLGADAAFLISGELIQKLFCRILGNYSKETSFS